MGLLIITQTAPDGHVKDPSEGPRSIPYGCKQRALHRGNADNFNLEFYEGLRMKLVKKYEVPPEKFDLFSMGYDSPTASNYSNSLFEPQGVIELTHNHHTENDENLKYHNENEEPRDFNHINKLNGQRPHEDQSRADCLQALRLTTWRRQANDSRPRT